MPVSTCFRTHSATALFTRWSYAALSYARPVTFAFIRSSRSFGRGRLPTWAVRMRWEFSRPPDQSDPDSRRPKSRIRLPSLQIQPSRDRRLQLGRFPRVQPSDGLRLQSGARDGHDFVGHDPRAAIQAATTA